MRFSQLLADAGLAAQGGRGDPEVLSVTADSRRCQPHSCFVAVAGTVMDGHEYIPAAIAAGAEAIVAQTDSAIPSGVAYALFDDTHEAFGPLAQALHGWPARALTCVGVTGTNGKTTIAHLIRAILNATGRSAGM